MRSHWKWIAIGVLCVPLATSAWAQPNLAMSTVPNVIVSPQALIPYRVTIRNAMGVPLPGLTVTLAWPPAAFAMTCWCPGQLTPVAAVTNGIGTATFNIGGGGCINPPLAGTAVSVLVGGMPFTAVGQVSPDWMNPAGVPVPDCQVGLADAVAYTPPISTGAYSFCVDINSDGAVNLADAVVVTPLIAAVVRC